MGTAAPPPSAPLDAVWIDCAAFLRSLAVGATSVILAIYLARLGLSPAAIGLVVGAGLAGGALATAAVGVFADRAGRRRTLIAIGAAAALGYAALLLSDRPAVLAAVAFLGLVNGMGRDRGPAAVLEQAVLPQLAPPERRTWALAWYNVVLDAGLALGALAGGTPSLLMAVWGMDPVAAHRLTLLLCGSTMLVSAAPYLALTGRIEAAVREVPRRAARLEPGSRRALRRLVLLFGLDSLAGGLLNSTLIAYWFFERHGVSEAQLAVLFFAARALNAVSHLAAAWLAGRIGLLNTMVLTHLPSSLVLLAVPAAPAAPLAAGLFLAREALVEMDVPTRQSYVMAIVRPPERTLASSVTNLARSGGWAIGASMAGLVMQHVAAAGPLVAGAGLKIAYDLALYASFRRLRPPEEATRTGTEA